MINSTTGTSSAIANSFNLVNVSHEMRLERCRLHDFIKKFLQPVCKSPRLTTLGNETETEPDDRWLLEQSAKGDEGAYQRLVERYENLVWDLLNRMVHDIQDREELAQDVFLKAYFKLEQFRFESKFSTWIYTIAYRVALSYLRKAQIETVELDTGKVDLDQTDTQDINLSETGVVQEQIMEAVNALNLDDRTVVTLFHLHNCSIEEISVVVDKPQGTVKNQLFRARLKLKSWLSAGVT